MVAVSGNDHGAKRFFNDDTGQNPADEHERKGVKFDMSVSNRHVPLAGVLSNVGGNPMPGRQIVRKYMSTFTTRTKIRGLKENNTQSIIYKVSARFEQDRGIPEFPHNIKRISAAVRTNALLAADFMSKVKMYANFTGDFLTFDFSAITVRLSAALAYFAHWGSLTSDIITAGKKIRVAVLGTTAPPWTSSDNTVFIPRGADSLAGEDVFTAILYACAGVGSQVVTDALIINPKTGAYEIPRIRGAQLADACYHALRILASNYAQSDEGGVFATAMTIGIHSQVSVHAHTDEGGMMRDVLRSGVFSTSYGGMNTADRRYIGLPRPLTQDIRGYRSLVDSIALSTAGAVALCDPLVEIEGRYYPTSYASEHQCETDAGLNEDGTKRDASDLCLQVLANAGRFADIYAMALCDIFAFNRKTEIAANMITRLFEGWRTRKCFDHITFTSITPYFWIEPTSVVSIYSGDYKAYIHGYAQVAVPGTVEMKKMCEDVEILGSDSGVAYINIAYRSARTTPILQHLSWNEQDGLANIVIRQADPGAFVNVGGDPKKVADRMKDAEDISTYLWVRGDSCIFAPGELNYIEERIGLQVRQSIHVPTARKPRVMHVPDTSEWLNGVIEYRVDTPQGISENDNIKVSHMVNRARTIAMSAIAYSRYPEPLSPGVPIMPVQFFSPPRRSERKNTTLQILREVEKPAPQTLDKDEAELMDTAQAQSVRDKVKDTQIGEQVEINTFAAPNTNYRHNVAARPSVEGVEMGERDVSVTGHGIGDAAVPPS